ncbi:leucyl/phenylalanyl-tRNA--protein transferase [mine drainage metagenome]|uniref:Leucyl/phenylalanyl-tRNA--protein transferase n=1 Tax=mine drainage metagenome TaxID=410659 RepID=A0A1J5QX59_9ZZZZ
MTWKLAQLRPGDAFPPPSAALPAASPLPGLLAVGGRVDADSLRRAYADGIFPWYEPEEPVLWWSTDPRMVLRPAELRVHRSLRRSVRQRLADARWQLRVDADFRGVMRDCAAPRRDGAGSWIGDDIVDGYGALHDAGLAHSFELYFDDQRVAGLYAVSIGAMLFGESMYTRVADGSKLLLMALCGFALRHGLGPIDCQQQTVHLASLGATPWPRREFLHALHAARQRPGPAAWRYDAAQMRSDCAAWL